MSALFDCRSFATSRCSTELETALGLHTIYLLSALLPPRCSLPSSQPLTYVTVDGFVPVASASVKAEHGSNEFAPGEFPSLVSAVVIQRVRNGWVLAVLFHT